MALGSHPDKNNFPQASSDFCMIIKANQGFGDVLRHNDAMRRTRGREEYIQCQEEAWREDEQIRKSQEES